MPPPKEQAAPVAGADSEERSYWRFVPSLTLIRGLGSTLVFGTSATMFKSLGMDNETIGYLTLLTFPAFLKFAWAPFADLYFTKRQWTIASEFMFGLSLLGLAFGIARADLPMSSLIWIYSLIPLAYAVGEFACDGFFVCAIPAKNQTSAVALLTIFARIASVLLNGVIFLAGLLAVETGSMRTGWAYAVGALGVLITLLAALNCFVLPRPASDAPPREAKIIEAWLHAVKGYITIPGFVPALCFLLLFRLGESIVMRMANVFFVDTPSEGGLGLSLQNISLISTVGIAAMLIGGALAGFILKKYGARRAMVPLSLAMVLPNICYVLLAEYPCHGGLHVSGGIVVPQVVIVVLVQAAESLGYGLAFTFFFSVIVGLTQGAYRASHMAFSNAVALVGYMVPNTVSGVLQEHLGWTGLFLVAVLLSVPGLVVLRWLPVECLINRGSANGSK